MNRQLSKTLTLWWRRRASVALAACSSSSKKSDGGVVARRRTPSASPTSPAGAVLHRDVQAVQEERARSATSRSSDRRGGDAAKLTTDVQSLLDQKVDGVIVSGGPLEAAPALLNAAKQAKTPVVMVDRKLKAATTPAGSARQRRDRQADGVPRRSPQRKGTVGYPRWSGRHTIGRTDERRASI